MLAGKNFSTDRKLFVILRVFASSWWIGPGPYQRRREESPSFLVAALPLGVHVWLNEHWLTKGISVRKLPLIFGCMLVPFALARIFF
ncbi:MAG: hypothetical protein DMG08_30250, partial [Acidobacteria bacterium]